jgi:hypothetical protein
MLVHDLRREYSDNLLRISANVVWEDNDRSEQKIIFEVDSEFESQFSDSLNPFLVACAVPALQCGEERIALDGTVCPLLREGVSTNLAWINHWYRDDRPVPKIEAAVSAQSERPRTARTAAFLSGGVDSLFTLRWNRQNVPGSHALSIKDVVIVKGIEPDQSPLVDRALEAVARNADATLISVQTNLRELNPDGVFWEKRFHGAALASVAHSLGGRINQVLLASTDHIPNIVPHGSHPLLDQNWSSQDLRIIHDGERFSRLDKIRVLCDWQIALDYLRVCTRSPQEALNCGVCEKCIRTSVALVAVGKLDKCAAMPLQDVGPELIRGLSILDEHPLAYYAELLTPLVAIGRDDLAHEIQQLISTFRTWEEWRDTAIEEITANVTAGSTFILADESEWGTEDYVGECRRVFFNERDGVYWGPPTDDQTALIELERLRTLGAEFLIVCWPAFWWLEYFPRWADLLRSRFLTVLQNDRQIIFDMRV